MSRDLAANAVARASERLPQSPEWRCTLVDAAVLAAVIVAAADGRMRASARMRLLVALRRAGLMQTPREREIASCAEARASELGDAAARRHLVARAMNGFVGTPWSALIVQIAGEVATEAPGMPPASRHALQNVKLALGIAPPPRRPAPAR